MPKPRPSKKRVDGSPDAVLAAWAGAAALGAKSRPGRENALELMQAIYDLDAILARVRRCGFREQDMYGVWNSYASVIRLAYRPRARNWAIDVLRIVAVRHGLDPLILGLRNFALPEDSGAGGPPRAG